METTDYSEFPKVEKTIYIIDDDTDVRTSLSRVLIKRAFAVETFESAKAFLDACDYEAFGCIILDQGMPGMTGLELQQTLVAKGSALPIIFITGHGGVPESVQAMKAGAVNFLEKPFRTAELIESIDTAFEALAQTTKDRITSEQVLRRFASLTPRESEIAEFIVSNPSLTTSKDIAIALHISPRTVDHHRARILEKMNIKSIVELVELSLSVQLNKK